MTEKSEQTPKEILSNLLQHSDVLKQLKKWPSTRHEAWLLITALSNLVLLEETEKLNKHIKSLLKESKKGKK
jgi:hypothetical protein